MDLERSTAIERVSKCFTIITMDMGEVTPGPMNTGTMVEKIIPKQDRILSNDYSYLREFTGFARAALKV